MSNDPIGISGGLNLYEFCGNNPVNFTDPWGLRLTAGEIANIVFNETRSLSGSDVDNARRNVIFAIINGDEIETTTGKTRPKTASTKACPPEVERETFDNILEQVLEALVEYYELGEDPTSGATHFNQRSNDSREPFQGHPLRTQNGPLKNSFPTKGLPSNGVYSNTYE